VTAASPADLLAAAQLLRLASPALPIGAFAWSGGLEGAIAEGLVSDEESAGRWIRDLLELGHGRWDAPILWTMLTRPETRDRLDALYLASRETKELRAETLLTGHSLMRLLAQLDPGSLTPRATLPRAWAEAADAWRIPSEAALLGWLVATLEHQLAVLMKALPLGQVAAQRLHARLLPLLVRVHESARQLPEAAWSSGLPGLAQLSARHETQYSRLFRS
jgi:urease accessory protein